MPAVALTDQSNLFAMVKFYKEAQAAGVKPLIGVDVWIRESGERAPPSRIVFLCQNLAGYRHLTQLVTRSYLEGQRRGAPMMERGWLQRAMLEGLDRPVRRGGRRHRTGARARPRRGGARAVSRAGRSCAAIGSTSRCSAPGARARQAYAEAAVDLARERGVPAVATNDVRFLDARGIRGARGAGLHSRRARCSPTRSRARRYSEEQYLKSPGGNGRTVRRPAGTAGQHCRDRQALFARNPVGRLDAAGLPRARGQHDRRVPARGGRAWAWPTRLAAQAQDAARFARDAQAYAARLDLELGVICTMGFAGYFLIVADFIRWARGARRAGGSRAAAPARARWSPIVARHHRPRSDRTRPAVRAIPESGTRVDAGFRRRFLHGGPRPGHRIRRQQIRPRPRLADHHLRHPRGEGGGARRGARARPQLRLRRQDRQADSFRDRHHARQGARAGGGTAAPVRGRSDESGN